MGGKPKIAENSDEVPVNAEEVMRQFDKESDFRILSGFIGRVIAAICIAFSIFQLYTAMFGVLDAMMQR